MAFNFSPRVVQEGLVLYLDAANTRSYVSGSTVWNDLTANGNSGTLTNGPTYNSAEGGSIVFDGLNDYVSGSASIVLVNSFTISAWINQASVLSGQKRYLTVGSEIAVIRQNTAASQLHFYFTTNSTFRQIIVSNAIQQNNWYYITGTWDGTTGVLYQNAINVGSIIPGGTLNGGSLNYAVGSALSPGETMNGRIAATQIYNRALSAQEVLQNYNALKPRFNLT